MGSRFGALAEEVYDKIAPVIACTLLGCPQDPKENSFSTQKGTHEANLMLDCSNRSEASSVGGQPIKKRNAMSKVPPYQPQK